MSFTLAKPIPQRKIKCSEADKSTTAEVSQYPGVVFPFRLDQRENWQCLFYSTEPVPFSFPVIQSVDETSRTGNNWIVPVNTETIPSLLSVTIYPHFSEGCCAEPAVRLRRGRE